MKNTIKTIAVHPEYDLYQKNDMAFCTSLQVAEEFGKEHKNVLRDIEALRGQSQSGESSKIGQLKSEPSTQNVDTVADFFRDNFKHTTYTNSQNKKQPMYLMTRNGFTLLVMGYTGEKAMRIKIAFIKRFDAMEAFIRDYVIGRNEFPIFAQAVADAHNNPQPYHYSNEVNMIYRIVLGMDAKAFRQIHGLKDGENIRPFLSEAQFKEVRKLQKEDIRLLYRGVGYLERKEALTEKALTAIAH